MVAPGSSLTREPIPAPPPAGSTFLIMVEVLLWSVYTVGVIMVMVVVMLQ